MRIDDVGRLSPLARLAYWIRERHQIFLRKRVGRAKPWTDDEILQTTYFTNPYRENDKVTQWYADHIRKPFCDTVVRWRKLVFATTVFRWFNWPETAQRLLDNGLLDSWNADKAVPLLGKVLADGGKVFHGAYMITNAGSPKSKLDRVCRDYLDPVWHAHARLHDVIAGGCTLAGLHAQLRQFTGMKGSGFMAAQVVADLKYCPYLKGASDWWTWSSPGPGSMRGLEIVTGRPWTERQADAFAVEVNNLRGTLNRLLHKMPLLHAQDVQNCLCEFSKYELVRTKSGRAKRKYAGV